MSRGIDPANEAAVAATTARPVGFIQAEFPSGTVRVCTWHRAVSLGGYEWLGAGYLLAFSSFAETNDITANGLTISFSGVPAEFVSLAITDAGQGQLGQLFLGFLDESENLVADPELVFAGKLDVPQIEDGQDTCTITISYESRLIDLQRAREWRYTNESQQVLYPGDLGFEFVTSIQAKNDVWSQ